MTNWRLWLRWSWRDLRARWLQVAAIGLIIALGTGVFAGLSGQKKWRIDSHNLSYGRLHMYDLKLTPASGSYLDGEELLAALEDVAGVRAVEARLTEPTLLEVSHDHEVIRVRGRIVGVDVRDGGPRVNSVYVDEDSGRTLTPADSGHNVAVVEYKFARHHDLRPGDSARVSGDVALDLVGIGYSPEYFMVMPETGAYFAEADYAVLFVPLTTAQALSGREGLVNDAVILLDDGADRAAVQAALEGRLAAVFPSTGFEFTVKEDDPVYSALYSDAEGDQWLWNTMAMLFLAGAALGAFNLAGRMVEAQRREIGIGMALGLPRRWIALRPMLVGIQIAVLGTVLGLLVGRLVNIGFARLVQDMLPMPYWDFKFYLRGYIQATILGVTLPFLATLIPVWRAVRVAPVDATTSGYLVAKGGGLGRLLVRVPLPGKSFTQMPLRNVLRSPWRTALTALGIAFAIMIMTFIVGVMDSFMATMQRADDAYRYQGAGRILVDLDFFYQVDGDKIVALTALTGPDGQPLFTRGEVALQLAGTLIKGDVSIDTALELHDMARAIWVPALKQGALAADGPGLIISEKAAADLGVGVGDTVTLKHPRREGPLAFRLVESEVPVIGIHNNPLRPLSYMPLDSAAMMGVEGVANQVILDPMPGVTSDTIKAALLTQPGVTSARSITDFSQAVEDLLEKFTGVLALVQIVAVLLAFLIAFNSTSISVDERAREIATMFAFGLPLRTVTRMQMVENAIMGAAGTLIGLVLGWASLIAIIGARLEIEEPDLKFAIVLEPETVLLAAALGVIVVGLTPLLSIRRMRRMDIPSTLRVME
ncbi:MAG: ABC transporter permease [Anaerolineae bacterium]|nr:ABC transporter permease [Anaerolineae bacterium]